MLIGVDVDGVCADFLGACALLIMKENGINIWPSIQAREHSDEVEELLTKYQYTKELYGWLSPIPYAASILGHINGKYGDLVYITARPLSTKNITNWWLEEHGFPDAKVINVRESKIPAVMREGVDLFIEDRLRYALPLAQSGLRQVVLLNLYDISYRGVTLPENIYTARSWPKVEEVIAELWWYWEHENK